VTDLREFVTASRARQGLPPRVEDPATLRRLAALLGPNHKAGVPAVESPPVDGPAPRTTVGRARRGPKVSA
jgi:hypothetical protein